jgi:hypothetical protein
VAGGGGLRGVRGRWAAGAVGEGKGCGVWGGRGVGGWGWGWGWVEREGRA